MRLIINADDFGRSSEINHAVLQAHREGVLTSASLMAGGAAFDEAVEMARRTPSLAVGLHVVAIAGPAVLPRERIPHLLDGSGRFPATPVRSGWRYFWDATVQHELALELRAQFERFAGTGLPLSHVDGHQHMHVHPVILKLLVPLAREYGAKGFRLPRDDLALSLRLGWRDLGFNALWALVLNVLSGACQAELRHARLRFTDRTYGLLHSGRMREPYVMELLRRLRQPLCEIYFHPTLGPRLEAQGPNPAELRTLLSPAVRQVIRDRNLQLSSYQSIAVPEGAGVVC